MNLRAKTEVMVEHFRTHVKHKIGGRAKAMVVTDGRLHAVRYKLAFDNYIAEKGYTDVRTLVAFSGIVEDPDVPGKNFTEVGMNGGIKETELPERFDSHEYQVLLVAEKVSSGINTTGSGITIFIAASISIVVPSRCSRSFTGRTPPHTCEQ